MMTWALSRLYPAFCSVTARDSHQLPLDLERKMQVNKMDGLYVYCTFFRKMFLKESLQQHLFSLSAGWRLGLELHNKAVPQCFQSKQLVRTTWFTRLACSRAASADMGRQDCREEELRVSSLLVSTIFNLHSNVVTQTGTESLSRTGSSR